MRAGIPASRAAHATAWPWLPALAATTPAARSASESVCSLLTAPRTLNAPVRWRFSAFSQTSRPARREKVSEPYTGVARAMPSIRARACSMSASWGAVLVAKLEHLLEDLSNGGEGVELTGLDLVEEPPQLRVVGNRPLEPRLGAGRGDGEHLAREMLAAARVQEPVALEVGAVLLDLLPELGDVLPAGRVGEHDRRPPRALPIEGQDRAHLVQHRLRRRMVHLVDRDHVGNLHDPGFERLNRVARARHEHEQDGVGDRDHLDLALACSHGLEEDELLTRGVEDERGLQRRLGQATEVTARAHRADEDIAVEEVVGEADPVAEQRPLRERAGRVDRDHADGLPLLADVADDGADQTRLADAGRTGDADRVRAAGLRVELAHDLVGERIGVLHERDRPRKGAPVAGTDTGGERLPRELTAPRHGENAMRSRSEGALAGGRDGRLH